MRKIIRKALDDFNIKKQAEDLGIPVWQAPSLLFMLMGVVIIIAMTAVYLISQKYNEPEILIISEVVVVTIMFTIGNYIIQSIDQMARVNKMKSEFVSIASHQLKTPLAEINWEIELLLSRHREGLDERQVELVKRIEKSNNRMGRLVNDLLDVARIEQGKLALDREKVNLAELVAKVIANNELLARANNVEIKFKKPKSDTEAVIDRRRIGVVLDNLISNSIKYIRQKGLVSISICKDSDEFKVCVKDNGIGIPAGQQDHVFEKFFRSDNVSKFQVTGTGLGLYISKNIVEHSGGKIWFESRENEGTTFCFTLPADNN